MSTERNRLRRAALLGSAATFVVGVTSALAAIALTFATNPILDVCRGAAESLLAP